MTKQGKSSLPHAIANYLLSFLHTQLLLTIVAIPILVHWGLGFSFMTFVGNLIFLPILTIFLVISSLLLFAQVLGIPHGFLAFILNQLTLAWDWALSFGSRSWLIEYAHAHPLILWCIPISVLFVMCNRKLATIVRQLVALSILAVGIGCLFSLQLLHPSTTPLVCPFDAKLIVEKDATTSLTIIDKGFFGRKKSIEKFIDYEFKPWLVKQWGHVQIGHIRLEKPSQGALKAAQHICQLWHVDAVVLPFFAALPTKTAWRSFFELKKTLEEKGVVLIRV